MTTTRTFVLASGKGGVGKSTLALALADVLRDSGPVALMDFDPQGGVTVAAGCATPSDPLRASPVEVHGVTLYPGGRALAIASDHDLAERLHDAQLSSAAVVVDLSPALTDSPHAVAIAEADPLLIIARCDAAGLPNVAETAALAVGAGVPWWIVPTFRQGTALSREAEAFLRGRYGHHVTRTAIPMDAKAAEAAGAGRPVTLTAPRAKVSQAVRDLVAELLAGVPA